MLKEQLNWLAERTPRIKACMPTVARPLWSVIIPTHNRHDLLPMSLGSVLAQGINADQMEIEVMDDASSDSRVQEIVEMHGKGRVSYFRQSTNKGQFANVNEGINRSRGHWVHVLHDDDWVTPNFYSKMEQAISINPSIGAALSAIAIADSSGRELGRWPKERANLGVLEDWLWKVSTTTRIQTPAVVVKREVYETLGGYSLDFPWPGDWEMWIRIASHYGWVYQPEAVAYYRDNETSVSSGAKITGSNITDIRKAIDFSFNYLPPDRRDEVKSAATRYWTIFALRTARNMIKKGDFTAAANQLREALITDPSREVVLSIINLSKHIK